jgi:RNA polymerase sigma-70 factor (ECF subfamily)
MSQPGTEELEALRPYLLRYALLQLRDRDSAEDVVQETILAALEGRARFAGKSTAKTWLTGILKHKIIDLIRKKSREQPLLDGDDDASESEAVDALFQRDGHWQSPPADWGNPARALEDKRFREAFELCAKVMPERNARVFMMREVLDMSTEEICKELGITPTNLWVILHRARLALRECIEIKWGGAAA